MPVAKIPGTDKVIFLNPHTGDRVVNLSNYPDLGSSLKNEDVPVVGTWSDYSGSGGKGPQEVMYAGISNELSGDLHAKANDKQFDEVTNRGNRASTHRQRPKLVYMEVEDD